MLTKQEIIEAAVKVSDNPHIVKSNLFHACLMLTKEKYPDMDFFNGADRMYGELGFETKAIDKEIKACYDRLHAKKEVK